MEAVRGSGQSGFIKEFRLATSPDRRHLTVAPVQPYVRGKPSFGGVTLLIFGQTNRLLYSCLISASADP